MDYIFFVALFKMSRRGYVIHFFDVECLPALRNGRLFIAGSNLIHCFAVE
jgi:hypothetical protein